MHFRLLVSAIALAGMATLTGCNKIKIGYEYADWFFIYSIEENFDLDKTQRNLLKGEVAAYFEWHRKQMLPEYFGFTQYIAAAMKNGLTASEVDSGHARFKELHRLTMAPVTERAASLLVGLNASQIDGWLEKQKKKNDKHRKNFSGTLEQRLDHRYQRILEELEDWTGRLSKEQRKKIKDLNATLPWNGLLWLDSREKMQGRLAGMLKSRASKDSVRGFLAAYWVDVDSLRSPEYRIQAREFDIRLKAFILKVHNLLTPVQRRNFLRKLEKVSVDLRSLSRQD